MTLKKYKPSPAAGKIAGGRFFISVNICVRFTVLGKKYNK